MKKYIINFTPTGMVPTKELTPKVPISPSEIIDEVVEAKRLGASIVHLHIRDEKGFPAWEKERYEQVIEGIKNREKNDKDKLIICVSTSGRNWPEFEKRSNCLEIKGANKPDMASLTLSSLNFPKSASVNSPEMIQRLAAKMLEKGIKPELEAFDAGMVNYAKYLIHKNLVKPPFYFNLIFGNISSSQLSLIDIGSVILHLPEFSYWSLGGIGLDQLKANVTALLYGGGIRIGLEDNIYFDNEKKVLASNLDLLKRISDISSLLGVEPYTSGELRSKLNLI